MQIIEILAPATTAIKIAVISKAKTTTITYPLWNADDWATRGGLEKTNWNKGFHVDGCEASVQAKFCATQGQRWRDQAGFQDLDGLQYRRLSCVRQKYTIYNYCNDRVRYPSQPSECKRDRDV